MVHITAKCVIVLCEHLADAQQKESSKALPVSNVVAVQL